MGTKLKTETTADEPKAAASAVQKVVVDPALSKNEKVAALDVLEQDARQLMVASDEGMTGGELNNLRAVLIAKDTLERPPMEQAYEHVLQDLRDRVATEVAGDPRALLEQALAALMAVTRSPALNPPAPATDGEARRPTA